MKLDPDDIRKLAKMTLATKPEDVSCEAWIHLVGEYVEVRQRGEAPPERLRSVQTHAADCPECAEELAALEELVAGEEAG